MSILRQVDPRLYEAIRLEGERQKRTINLIPSENYASKAVLEVQGSFLSNKYAEGYPGRRYYGGCEDVDIAENLAIERVKELFHAEHANVQPHAGALANMAAYFALLNHGDTVMAMSLPHGGHLTHGSKVNFSGKDYNFVAYGVNQETERLDYDEMEKTALQCKPDLIVSGFTAYPRIIDFERIQYIADKVDAKHMSDIAHIAGLVAAGVHPSPVPYADVVTATTHKTLRGTRGAFILCKQELAKAIDSAVFPRMQGGPLMHSIAAKAVGFYEALQPAFIEYQKSVVDNARALASELINHGLRIVSGGTDNHLMLVDVSKIGITGKQAQEVLGEVDIVVNKNTIPFDAQPPMIGSGIRLGAPAVSTRGFGIKDMKQVGSLMAEVLKNIDKPEVKQQVRNEVNKICQRFQVPGID